MSGGSFELLQLHALENHSGVSITIWGGSYIEHGIIMSGGSLELLQLSLGY